MQISFGSTYKTLTHFIKQTEQNETNKTNKTNETN